jgi:hypothetical protein
VKHPRKKFDGKEKNLTKLIRNTIELELTKLIKEVKNENRSKPI